MTHPRSHGGGSQRAAYFVVSVVVSLSATALFAESPDSVTTIPGVRVVSAVSDDFQREVSEAVRSIPAVVWSAVCASGWRCELAEFLVDAAPDLQRAQPRGWPDGITWEQADAAHLPDARRLILAEKRLTTSGDVRANARVPGVLRHETGHAFDLLGTPQHPGHTRSSLPQFRATYHADVQLMTKEDRGELAYYLQQRSAGPQETYAEAFGIALGGGSDAVHQESFVRAFPQVVRYVQRELELISRPAPVEIDSPSGPRGWLERPRSPWRLLRR